MRVLVGRADRGRPVAWPEQAGVARRPFLDRVVDGVQGALGGYLWRNAGAGGRGQWNPRDQLRADGRDSVRRRRPCARASARRTAVRWRPRCSPGPPGPGSGRRPVCIPDGGAGPRRTPDQRRCHPDRRRRSPPGTARCSAARAAPGVGLNATRLQAAGRVVRQLHALEAAVARQVRIRSVGGIGLAGGVVLHPRVAGGDARARHLVWLQPQAHLAARHRLDLVAAAAAELGLTQRVPSSRRRPATGADRCPGRRAPPGSRPRCASDRTRDPRRTPPWPPRRPPPRPEAAEAGRLVDQGAGVCLALAGRWTACPEARWVKGKMPSQRSTTGPLGTLVGRGKYRYVVSPVLPMAGMLGCRNGPVSVVLNATRVGNATRASLKLRDRRADGRGRSAPPRRSRRTL